MQRVPEPELMLEDEQARVYAAADFDQPNALFMALLHERLPGLPAVGSAADLGCGPGEITLRFALAYPQWSVCGVDGSPAMLAWARRALSRARAETIARVRFEALRLPAAPPDAAPFDLVFSNSLLHHLADPGVLWATLRSWAAAGASVFAMDLARPADVATARALVERYAHGEPEQLRSDFYHSLLAAWRPDEVAAQIHEAGLAGLRVELVSDRHLAVCGTITAAESERAAS